MNQKCCDVRQVFDQLRYLVEQNHKTITENDINVKLTEIAQLL